MARVCTEDCQKKIPNRFELVVVAAKRARQLMGSSAPLIKTKNNIAVTALREIAEGLVVKKEHTEPAAPVVMTPEPEAPTLPPTITI